MSAALNADVPNTELPSTATLGPELTTLASPLTPTTACVLMGTRFGTLAFDPADVIGFPEGLIGFERTRRFVFVTAGAGSPFRWLQSLDDPVLAFLVADPDAFVPEYAPTLPRAALAALELGDEAPYLLWVTANIPPGRSNDATLNLAGPIVVNPENRRGRQVVLDGEAYTVRHRAFARREPTALAA